MIKVGLTGNYYSGQKLVSNLFEKLGTSVFDANLVLKFLVNYSPNHIDRIKSKFGYSIYTLGLLDLQKFTTNHQIDKLFEVVEMDILKAFENYRNDNKGAVYCVFLFDQLIERGFERMMDFNINVYRPKYIRRVDMTTYSTLGTYLISKILDNEIDELKKNSSSDFVIQNYNKGLDWKGEDVKDLENQIKKIHKSIMDKQLKSIVQSQYGI